jgi:hypothetical protein
MDTVAEQLRLAAGAEVPKHAQLALAQRECAGDFG